MASSKLLDEMRMRVEQEKQDGDVAYFNALSYQLEYITKLLVIAVIANNRKHKEYELELIRHDSVGRWVEILRTALKDTSNFDVDFRNIVIRQLTQKVRSPDWRFEAVTELVQAGHSVDLRKVIKPNQKVALIDALSDGVSLRNRTRAHGAPTRFQCGQMCVCLARVVDLLQDNLEVFDWSWAYFRRNQSGRYSQTNLHGHCEDFDSKSGIHESGVYVFVSRPVLSNLVIYDPSNRQIYLPNGNFREPEFESISYATNHCMNRSAAGWRSQGDESDKSPSGGPSPRRRSAFSDIPPAEPGASSETTQNTADISKTVRIDPKVAAPLILVGLVSLVAILVWLIPSRESAQSPRTPQSPQSPPASPPSECETNSIGMEFTWIPAGRFDMGSRSREAESDERPITSVQISEGFCLGKYEVMQAQWKTVMGRNPSQFLECGLDCPVERVSWIDTQNFIRQLTNMDGEKGVRSYRLPTEAEWEYAARGNTTAERYARLGEIAWHNGNSAGMSNPVGQKQPNSFGLYDMLGNVWEWVHDWKGEYPSGTVIDPIGPSSGAVRVYRGGSWSHDGEHARAASRWSGSSYLRNNRIGFRLVMDPLTNPAIDPD